MKVRYRDVAVPAVSEEALPGVLRKLGLYEDAASGKAACHVCGAIAKLGGKTVLICSKPSCIGKASLLASKARAHRPTSPP